MATPPHAVAEGDVDVGNGARIADFLKGLRHRQLSDETLDAAKMCLADWLAVCLGARNLPEAGILAGYASLARHKGAVPLLSGGTAAPTVAALVNGALSHCLDYDDTHIPTALHGSGPTWAAVLAIGTARSAGEESLLKAFVGGFEVGASLGSEGLGVRLNENGWHATAVLGRLSAASAAAFLLGLDADATRNALGLAATQAGGLTASFGTMAKPFHAGKAAMDGILSAELAAVGLEASQDLLDSPRGLFGTIFQDRQTVPRLGGLGVVSEIMQNSLKPYAACQLTHAPIDAAFQLRSRLQAGTEIEAITVFVNPLAVEIAGVRGAATPTAARFSIGYCVALALGGYPVSPDDFVARRIADPRLTDMAGRVSLVAAPDVARTACRMEARLADGTTIGVVVEHAFGSIGNPMGWPQLRAKFMALVEPHLGAETAPLLETLASFERPGSFVRVLALLDRLAAVPARPSSQD